MDHPSKDFLHTYYYGSFWAFKHYDKIIRRAFNCLHEKPKVAVEVGCGDGMATYFLSKRVDHLICMDTNEECIRIVKRMLEETGIKNVEFKMSDSEKLSLDREVDLIFLKDVLHHMQSPVGYLKSCLPFSHHLLMIEANRYNPLLYWICRSLEDEELFLKMNSLRIILRLVEKGGWRCEESFHVEAAAYPIGYCIYHDVFGNKSFLKSIIQSLDKVACRSSISFLIDKGEDWAEKILSPFCSEFIIFAKRQNC